MYDTIKAAVIAATNAAIAAITAFGVNLTADQVAAIVGLVNAAFVLALAVEVAWKHDPNPPKLPPAPPVA